MVSSFEYLLNIWESTPGIDIDMHPLKPWMFMIWDPTLDNTQKIFTIIKSISKRPVLILSLIIIMSSLQSSQATAEK